MTTNKPLHLFEGYGVEIEYMIVDKNTHQINPLCDWLLHSFSGTYEPEVEGEIISWSNELALHVVELKTNGPTKSLSILPDAFHKDVQTINQRLSKQNAKLMPTAMHPGMNPGRETRLWPHEYNEVYETFNQIFDCKGHGWSNLQSIHINLPFYGDEEFGRLHAAIRILLPLLPALAASSPIVEFQRNGILDNRMQFYRFNSAKIPAVTGMVVPEDVFTRDEYQSRILKPLYEELAPYDPGGILQYEWANARGTIARFDRNTIEIRVLDVQECPQADLTIVWTIVQILRSLINEQWSRWEDQKRQSTSSLADLLYDTTARGMNATINIPDYSNLFGFDVPSTATVGDLWNHLAHQLLPVMNPEEECFREPLQTLITQGSLSARINQRLSENPAPDEIMKIYGELCDCLEQGKMFHA